MMYPLNTEVEVGVRAEVDTTTGAMVVDAPVTTLRVSRSVHSKNKD